MKKILLIALAPLTILTISLITSCSNEEDNMPTTATKWRVEKIQPNAKSTSAYLLMPIEKGDLNANYTWIIDSVGKFNAGDTLSFQRCQ
jgi:hypothetical protein